MGRKGKHLDPGSDDFDASYTRRSRDRVNPDKPGARQDKRRFEKDDSWSDALAPARQSRVNYRDFAHIIALKPQQDQILTIFRHPIDVSEARAFVKGNRGLLSNVQLADMITRASEYVFRRSVRERRLIGPEFISFMSELYDCFRDVPNNYRPRELSAFIRGLVIYSQLFDDADDSQAQNVPNPRKLFDEFVSMWRKSLSWDNPNLIDLCHAAVGMMAGRNIYARDFTFERGSDSHICNAVKETFQKLSDTLDQVDAQALPDIIRVLRCSIMSKIFSRSLMHRIRDVLLARELDGSSKIEQLSGDSKMAWINTTEVIYRLAAFGVWSPNELVRIEGHIRESVNSDDWGSLQSDAAADFLSACCLYNYKLDLELVEKLEQLLVVELQGRDTTQALFCRVAHYAGLGILFQKGSMSPDMWRIAERAADENEERASTFQERVMKLLRMTGLKVVENYRVGSCTFDAAVFISKDQLINVEIDGFPYHSVFLLDEMRFCREAQTPGNRLRDAALKKLGIPVLRLTGEICASGSDRAQAADLKRKIEVLVAAKRV